MQEPPYDRALALAAQVRSMRDHFLDVSCGCGDHRVIALGLVAKDRQLAAATLADLALRLTCHGCYRGPDEIYLCATSHGRSAPEVGGGNEVWTLPLHTKERQPSYHLRRRSCDAG